MNELNRPEDWDKMVIDSDHKNEKMVRINISLSEKCYNAIDFYKNNVGLFTGRTDYILSAIKFLYFDIIDMADDFLVKEKETQSSKQKQIRLKEKVTDKINTGLDLSRAIYDGKRDQQTTLYVSERIRSALSDLESLTGKKTGDVILAAIAIYHVELVEKIEVRNKVIRALNVLHAEAHNE